MQQNKKKLCKRILLAVLAVVLVLLLGLLAVISRGNTQLRLRPDEAPDLADGDSWYWQDDHILMADGVAYRPREHLINVLCIGLGTSSERETSGFNRGMMPMADTFVLAVLDPAANHVTLLSIPRDTQTVLDSTHADSSLPALTEKHLALQYRYGGTDTPTCTQTTRDTVSRLLYDVGIHAAVTIDMDSIVVLADLLGGVPITIPDDPWYCAYTGYQPGQWVSMDGPTALQFVQYRDLSVPGSCEIRVERQKLFADAILNWFYKAVRSNPGAILYCFQQMQPYYYTDLDLTEITALGASLAQWNMQNISMRTLPGTVEKGVIYEEYHVDVPAARQMLLEIFYEPVQP